MPIQSLQVNSMCRHQCFANNVNSRSLKKHDSKPTSSQSYKTYKKLQDTKCRLFRKKHWYNDNNFTGTTAELQLWNFASHARKLYVVGKSQGISNSFAFWTFSVELNPSNPGIQLRPAWKTSLISH